MRARAGADSIILRDDAQNRILSAIVAAALQVEENESNAKLADAIRAEGAKIARRYGISEVSGLPATFPQHDSERSVVIAGSEPSAVAMTFTELVAEVARVEREILTAAERFFQESVNPNDIRVSFQNGRWWIDIYTSSHEREVYRVDRPAALYTFESVGREPIVD